MLLASDEQKTNTGLQTLPGRAQTGYPEPSGHFRLAPSTGRRTSPAASGRRKNLGAGAARGAARTGSEWLARIPGAPGVRRRSSRRVPSLCSRASSLFIVAGEAAAALYPEQQSEKRSSSLGGLLATGLGGSSMETGERTRFIFILVLQLLLRVRRNQQQRCRRVLYDRPVFPR